MAAFNCGGNIRSVPDQTSNAYTRLDHRTGCSCGECRRRVQSLHPVLGGDVRRKEDVAALIQHVATEVGHCALLRVVWREHTYLSATDSPRDGPLPAMKPNADR